MPFHPVSRYSSPAQSIRGAAGACNRRLPEVRLYFSPRARSCSCRAADHGHAAIEIPMPAIPRAAAIKYAGSRLVAADPLADGEAASPAPIASHRLHPARRFGRSPEAKHQTADENRGGNGSTPIRPRAKRRVPDEGCHRRRALLRNLPPGASRHKFQPEQNIKRAMPLVPRCEVRQLRRPHPEFQNYPFKRRTRIIYDHASHFGKHYPDLAKKDPAKSPPATCSACHNSNNDRRVMATAPFDRPAPPAISARSSARNGSAARKALPSSPYPASIWKR